MRKLTTILFAIIVLAGCATLPKPRGGTGLLIIPIHNDGRPEEDYLFRYNAILNTGERLRIDPDRDYQIVSGLEPGEYVITQLESVYKDSRKFTSEKRVYLRFKIESDTITTLGYALEVSIEDQPEGVRVQHRDFVVIPAEEIEALIEKFKQGKNSVHWSFRY